MQRAQVLHKLEASNAKDGKIIQTLNRSSPTGSQITDNFARRDESPRSFKDGHGLSFAIVQFRD